MFKFFEHNIRDKIIMLITITSLNLYVLFYHFYSDHCTTISFNMCPQFLPMELIDTLVLVLTIPIYPYMAGSNTPFWAEIYVRLAYFITATIVAFIVGKFLCDILSKLQKKE